MKKIICLMASAFILSAQAKAQLVCGTDDLYNKQKKENPEINETELRLSAEIKAYIERKEAGSATGKTTATVYDIPLVIHVIHDYGSEYVSDNAIFDAVAYWDKSFNAENADITDVLPNFKKYIGDADIRLHLATIDPSGNPTKGITRHQSYLTGNGGDNAKLDDWPNNKYINVWLINRFSPEHSGAAAYAYYPSSGARLPFYDGAIGLASYLNVEKTYPHELGHVLNLQHTWGNDNSPAVRCGDDEVADTPPTFGHTSCSPADLYDTRCATGYTDASGKLIPNSTAAADTANTQNIMDYSYCMRMFTIGQTDRMRATLGSSVAGRNNLISASNLAATGALKARPDLPAVPDFSVEKGQYDWGGTTAERTVFLCQNSTTKFRFKNQSWNDTIANVSWSFSNGASTPTSTEALYQVGSTFANPGWMTVTFSATGNNTPTQTINRQAVYVASTTAYVGGYNQYFNSPADFTDWPMFNHYNNNFKWEFNGSNGYPTGAGCIRYRSFDARTGVEAYSNNPEGDFDDLYTPAFNFSTISSPSGNVNLNFFTAGCVTPTTSYNDSMTIFASTSCGDNWVRITSLKFGDLINNGGRSTEFAPTSASNWKGQTINVPADLRSDKTFFRFRYYPCVGGNNLYMDNFTISPWTTEIKEVAANTTNVKLFPNPTSGNTKLCFTAGATGEAMYMIRDVTGKVITQKSIKNLPNSFVQEEISRDLFPAAGVYLITLTQSEQTSTQKLVVE